MAKIFLFKAAEVVSKFRFLKLPIKEKEDKIWSLTQNTICSDFHFLLKNKFLKTDRNHRYYFLMVFGRRKSFGDDVRISNTFILRLCLEEK